MVTNDAMTAELVGFEASLGGQTFLMRFSPSRIVGNDMKAGCLFELVPVTADGPKPAPTDFASRVQALLGQVGDLLIAKNKSYGDSALNPVGIFAHGDAEALICVRIDDKLSRIRNAPEAFGEDVINDLLGYLVLLKLARQDKAAAP